MSIVKNKSNDESDVFAISASYDVKSPKKEKKGQIFKTIVN